MKHPGTGRRVDGCEESTSRSPSVKNASVTNASVRDPACPFCSIVADEAPAHVVLRDDVGVGFLDRRPVFKGHVLWVPTDHIETLADLPVDAVGPFFERGQRTRGSDGARTRQRRFVRGDQQSCEPERAAPAPARRAPQPQGRPAGILLAANEVRVGRRDGRIRRSTAGEPLTDLAPTIDNPIAPVEGPGGSWLSCHRYWLLAGARVDRRGLPNAESAVDHGHVDARGRSARVRGPPVSSCGSGHLGTCTTRHGCRRTCGSWAGWRCSTATP